LQYTSRNRAATYQHKLAPVLSKLAGIKSNEAPSL